VVREAAARNSGDFATVLEDVAADDVSGGVVVRPRGGEARVARQQPIRALRAWRDTSSEGRYRCWPWTSENRSALQRWMLLPGFARLLAAVCF
jgi:hypothetical protein